MKCICRKSQGSTEPIYECEKLSCRMTPDWCQLYQTHDDYRRAWDEARGPGQIDSKPRKPARELPPFREQAVNFLKAFAKWTGDCFRCVGQEEFDRRVGICMDCDLFIRRFGKSGRCSECGCYGKLKALGRIWECPIGKW